MSDREAKVWIESPKKDDTEIFVLATLVSQSGSTSVVRTDDGKEHKVPTDKVWFHNPPVLEGTDDLTSLSHMHEPGVLHNLKTRYFRNQIYSKSGPIFIAVNPFQKLPLYSDGLLNAYCSQSARQLPPHVYAVGDQAFQAMTLYDKNQSILVTGESGAGKTETTKILLQYFAAKGKKADESNIQDKVLGSTPILEAFGNAKTLRNDNSSRFGKFILVDFDFEGSIIGARTKTYLLEKSRLIHQAVGERNYHIFYQLCGAVAKDINVLPSASTWKLKPAEEYEYLNGGGDLDLGFDEADSFAKTRKALEVVGLSVAEIDDICTLLSSILSLGNIKFYNNDKDAALLEPNSKEWLDLTTSLLGADSTALLKAVTAKRITTGKDSYDVPLNKVQAEVARDSLAMFLYETLFLWLVDRINVSMKTKEKEKNFIGILDIYGFESFQVNSFEQFCINYANEKLQQQFNQFMFKLEQEEYQKEEIDWTYVKFTDNQPCIKLIEKPQGILETLDEESKLARATPQTFATKLAQKNARNPFYEKPRFSDHAFLLRHYPGQVEYDTTHFIDKNKNRAQPEFLRILKTCKNKFVNKLYENVDESVSEKQASVSAQFKESLTQLMDTISETEPNYIRCIKPNDSKKPSEFAQIKVLEQLRCNGVLEAIRIARDGFPTRYLYSGFWNRFRMLVDFLPEEIPTDPKEQVRVLMQRLNLIAADQYQCGKTKIFLKSGQLAAMEERRTAIRIKSIVTIQKFIRGANQQKIFGKSRNAALILQAFVRRYIAITLAEQIRRELASKVFQRYIRSWIKRKSFLVELERKKSAEILQKNIRMWRHASDFQNIRSKAVVIQTKLRGMKARREFLKLKQEAQKTANILLENRRLLDLVQELRTELSQKSAVGSAPNIDREEVERNEEERKALKAKVEFYEAEISQKTEQLSRAEQNEIKLSAELASWRQKQKDHEKEAENAKKDAEEAISTGKAKDSEIQALTEKIISLETKLEEQSTKVSNMRKSLENSAKREDALEKLHQEIAEKAQIIADLKLEKDNIINENEMKWATSQEERRQVEDRLHQLQSQMNEEGQKWSQYELENQNLTTKYHEIQTSLEQSKKNFENEKQFLEKRVTQIQVDSDEKSQKILQLQWELEHIKSNLPNKSGSGITIPPLDLTSPRITPNTPTIPPPSPTSTTREYEKLLQAHKTLVEAKKESNRRHAEEIEKLKFEFERERMVLQTKLHDIESLSDQRNQELVNARQENRKMGAFKKEISKKLEDTSYTLENETREKKQWYSAYHVMKEEMEKKLKEQATHFNKEIKEHREKNLQMLQKQKREYEEKLRTLSGIAEEASPYDSNPTSGASTPTHASLKRVVTQRFVRRLSVSIPESGTSGISSPLLPGTPPKFDLDGSESPLKKSNPVAHPTSAPNIVVMPQQVIIPEKKIAEALAKNFPSRYDQFKSLVEALLSEKLVSQLTKNTEIKASIANSGVPLPAFVLLRYIMYINHMDKSFLQSEEVAYIPTVIKQNIPKVNDDPHLIVPYLHIASSLMTSLATVAGSLNVLPQPNPMVSLFIDWMRRDKVEPTITSGTDAPSGVVGQLQSIVCLLYGKLLRDIVKKLYHVVEPSLLSNPSAIPAIEGIVNTLAEYLEYFRDSSVEEYLIVSFFGDCIRLLDISIFNQIILRKDLCSFSKAFQLKPALEEIERRLERYGASNWISDKHPWFSFTKQILASLTMDKKILCYTEGRRKHCPSMSLMQLRQMCTLYQPEEFENSIIGDVISSLMQDPKFNFNDPLLFNHTDVKLDTSGIPAPDPTDLQNWGFSSEVVEFVISNVSSENGSEVK